MFQIIGLFLTVVVALATALEPAEHFEEGSCSGVPLRPVKADRDWVNSLEYIAAGSKYHFYNLVSSLPNYRSLREDEFYYDSCVTRNTSGLSKSNSVEGVFGFGRLLTTFDITTRPGIYLHLTSRDSERSTLTATVTLTDNKSYAVIVACRHQVDQRAWVMVTNQEKLDPKIQRKVADHAASLGFKKENFVFLRYDSCHWGNPLLEHDEWRNQHEKLESHHHDAVGSGWTP